MTHVDERGRLVCIHCGLPWARVQDGVLIVESRHGGEKHVNVIRLEDVIHLLRESEKETA